MEYTTAEVNRDDNGDIDTQYYLNASIDIIEREAERMGIDKTKITTNRFNGALREVYRCLYQTDNGAKRQHHEKCKTEYTEENIGKIAEVYTELCARFDVLPSADGFSIMTGIDENTGRYHLTGSHSTIQNSRKNAVLNKAFEHPVGVLALANNDPETGLMFARQNMIASQEIKHIDSISQLEDMRKRSPGNVSQIEQKEDD